MQRREQNIAVTQAIFGYFGAHDIPGIVEHLTDDIVIEFYGPPVIPYAGTWRGQRDAERFFSTVLGAVDIHQFDAEEFLADGDKVIVTGHLRLTAHATERDIESDFVHVITLRDGRWQRFRDFMNTAVAAAAFTR